MNFIKTFLAAILAFVVGSVLVVFLWIFILLGIAGSMEKSVAVHPESILKLDFSEVLTDARRAILSPASISRRSSPRVCFR